ncbi:MAG: hypothetical protein GY807_21715 [Gammaproteobacteria bacterium]|nr:hypothetical protein [Gammaproteobacteria bacterium]
MPAGGPKPSWTELTEVIATGDEKKLQQWIDEGLDLEASYGKNRWTALHIAASYVKSRVPMERLLDAGSDMEARAAMDWTPLHVACHYDRKERVKALLKRGADIQAITDSGDTPLAVARNAEHMELVEAIEAISAKHTDKTKRLKVLRDRKRNSDG